LQQLKNNLMEEEATEGLVEKISGVLREPKG
jgi:hypothetical protein